jgi:hypothetical protein
MPPIGGLAGDSARRNAHLLSGLLGNQKLEVDRGIGGLEPGAPPPYVAITHLHFDSVDDFQIAFGPHAERITGMSQTSQTSGSRCKFLRS